MAEDKVAEHKAAADANTGSGRLNLTRDELMNLIEEALRASAEF